MSEVFFTADTHFGHRMLVEKGHRPQYSTVAEMDADLIERWNATVRPGDVVWHLGDFGLGGMVYFLPIVAKLHGTIHLIAGNHDHVWAGNRQAHKHQRHWGWT